MRALNRVLDLLYPPRCAFCDKDLESAVAPLLCDLCRQQLAPPAIPRCPMCGAATPGAPVASGCRRCKDRKFEFRGVACLGAYEAELQKAVLRTKSHRQDRLARELTELLWLRTGAEIANGRPEVVAPMPMHWTRRIRRGTNSSETIAEVLAASLGVPALPLLRRVRRTQRQGSLPRDERFRNVKKAFGMRRGCRCAGARVLLVDDIMTTGATCGEAAKVLRQAGAVEIAVAVLARAEGPD